MEFRPTCRRGCAMCPSRVRPVGSPPLSLRTARIRTANHAHLPRNVLYACCYSGLFDWKQRSATPPNPLGDIHRKVSMSRVVKFFRHFIMYSYVCLSYMFYCIYPGTNNTLLYFILLICEVFTFLDCYLFHVLNCYKMFLLLNCDTFHVLFCKVFTSY